MNKSAVWINTAIEEVAQTAIKDNEYWRGTYTEQDGKAVALLKKYMEDAGFSTYFDAVGNLFGRIEGRKPEIVMSGSHRDTVKQGGKYDGMLGVVSAIRAAGDLYREFGQPEYTVETVAICEEESSRFPTNFLGSRNICGELKPSELTDVDESGTTLGQAIKNAGYSGEPIAEQGKNIKHMVELHIEQGNLLEYEKKQIGVVTSIVGIASGQITIKGVQNHAGTTPMRLRIDPMPVAAEFIFRLHQWAETHMDDMVCTIGRISAKPGNANVIPSEVTFTYDIRSAKLDRLEEAKTVLYKLKAELEQKTEICITAPDDDLPVELNSEGIEILKQIAEEKGLEYMEIPSGAGHDSQIFALHYDTNMIFVPSQGGISHDVREYTKAEDIEAGYLVLKDYLKKLAW